MAALLAACGGDGSSTQSGYSGSATGWPTPQVKPTPGTPTTRTYTVFAELTGNQSFATTCSGVSLEMTNDILHSTAFGQGIGLDYIAATATWSVDAEGTITTFDESDLATSSTEGVTSYVRTSASGDSDMLAIVDPQDLDPLARYVRQLSFTTQSATGDLDSRNCVFGVPTDIRDHLPDFSSELARLSYGDYSLSGKAYAYHADGSKAIYSLSPSVVNFSVSPTDGTMSVSIELVGNEITPTGVSDVDVSLGSIAGSTTMEAGQQTFGGDMDWQNAGPGDVATGKFGGWFFGPQGTEVGFAFDSDQDWNDGSKLLVTGTVLGTGEYVTIPE